ncbi:MAG: DUF6502 family protein [Gammaproteobacteria bacterium]
MAVSVKGHVLAACRQWLKALVHVPILCGVTWKEFSDLSRLCYVDVAMERFGRRGRPTNVSRTAMLTGLARREVRKQRELLQTRDESWAGYVTKGSLLLSAWHQDPEFIDARGEPKRLALQGPGATFSELARRCGASDIPVPTLLKELKSAGAVAESADGLLEARMRSYIPKSMDERLIRLWGSVVADVGSTFGHNLTRTAREPSRFERAAVNDRVDPRALPEFRKFLELEGQRFLERVDAWLTAHEIPGHERASSPGMRLGAGVYHVQD